MAAKRKKQARPPVPEPASRASGSSEGAAIAARSWQDAPSRFVASSDVRAAAAIAALAAIVYIPAMAWGGFVWDDWIITNSPAIERWNGLMEIWFEPYRFNEPHYWPLVYSSFWLEHKLWGFDPTGYHVVNVVLHCINSVLLLRILRKLAIPGAWLAAALFAVHPVHVESVAWAVERKDMLSGLFYLAAVLAWLRFQDRAKPGYCLLALALLALGMLSKSVVVTLPAALVIVQWWRRGRIDRIVLLHIAPFFVVAAGFALGDVLYLRSRFDTPFDFTFIERLLIAAQAVWFYAAKLVWPIEQAVIYPLWEVSATAWTQWLYVVAGMVAAAALWGLRHHIGRGPFAGALFFVVTLSPTLGFFDHYYLKFSFVADRFQYLASIGPIVVVAAIAAFLYGKLRAKFKPPGDWMRGIGPGLAAAVLAVLGVLCWRQAAIYESPLTFFGHIVSLNPKAHGAYASLSGEYIQAGRIEEAQEAAEKTIEMHPEEPGGYNNLGLVMSELERPEEAEAHFQRALELDPEHEVTLKNLATMLHDQERHAEAIPHYQQLLKHHPHSQFALLAIINLGVGLNALERYAEAEAYFRDALRRDPDNATIMLGLADVLGKQGRHQESLRMGDQAAATDPESITTHVKQGETYWNLGRFAEALASYRKALAIDPNDKSALVGVGISLEQLGQLAEAERTLRKALEQGGGDTAASVALGNMLFTQGRREEALVIMRAAVARDGTSVRASVNLGSMLITMQHHEEAEELLRRARGFHPDDPNVLQNLAETLRVRSRLDEALEVYQNIVALDPGNALAHAAMGDTLFVLQRYAEAIPILGRAVELAPDAPFVPSMHVFMGRAAEALKRPDEAAEHYARALAASPDHAEATARLAELRMNTPQADGQSR